MEVKIKEENALPAAKPAVENVDDDDEPISAKIMRQRNAKLAVKEEKKKPTVDEADDDDEPISAKILRQRDAKLAAAKVSEASDSDDDLPIAALIKKRKLKMQSIAAAEVKKAKASSAPIASKKSAAPAAAKTETSSSKRESAETSNSSDSDPIKNFYKTNLKGRLIQAFLVRWWYAYEWPKLDELKSPPGGYESLEGFPGVYVSTRSDSLGKIIDMRDKSTCPNLANFMKKPSAEIKSLCVTAFEKQMEALKEAEGDGVKLYRELKADLAEIKRIDTSKADREGKSFERTFYSL